MPTLTLSSTQKDTFIMLFGLMVGLWFCTFNVIGFDFNYFPGDLGDGRLNLYFLEHAHALFSGRLDSFWDAPFMYPEKNVLSYSDNLLGSAPIYSIFRWFGYDTFSSYQWWFVVVSALNYLAAYYFLKYVFKNRYAALIGAFVFAFSIALQSQLTHAQTFPRYAIPLAFFMAVKFGEGFKPKYFFLAVFLVVYQIYCGIYLGFMLAIPIGLYFLIISIQKLIVEKKVTFQWPWSISMSVAAIVNVLILLPLMLPYMQRKNVPSAEHYEQIRDSIPTLKSHLFSQPGSLLWDVLSTMGSEYTASWDHHIFAGGTATICLLVGFISLLVVQSKSKWKTTLSVPFVLLFTGFLTFLFYLRFHNTSAYILLYYLPGFSSMRSVTRIINIELIFFAVGTSYVLTRLFRKQERYQLSLFLIAFALVVADNYFLSDKSYKTSVDLAKGRTLHLENAFAKIPAGSIVSYEHYSSEESTAGFQLDAMLASQSFGLTTINAYTGNCPSDYGLYWFEPSEQSRLHWLKAKGTQIDTLYVVKADGSIKMVFEN